MEMLNWTIQTSPQGDLPIIVSEYVLNDLGVFVKRERRMPKREPLTAVTGFRIGYAAVQNTNYRAAPVDRDVLLWHKITSVSEQIDTGVIIRGNRSSEIQVCFLPENKTDILRFIADKRLQHPVKIIADENAASWICWHDDDEWEDPFMPLPEMIELELKTARFLEQEVMEETVLTVMPQDLKPTTATEDTSRPRFCTQCGAGLPSGGKFCGHCGQPIKT